MGDPLIMSLAKGYTFAESNGLAAEAAEVRHKTAVHPECKKGKQVRKAALLDLFEARGLLQRFLEEHWRVGLTDRGRERRERYNVDRENNRNLLQRGGLPQPEREDHTAAEEQAFAFERDLRDFLANNLGVIEPGLQLFREGDRKGIEFIIDDGGGRIDVLAIDARGVPVVIELKLSRGRNQTIGQLLYYMGWVDRHLGKDPSRGIIVAKEIQSDLILAIQRVPGVALFSYTVAMTLTRVAGEPAQKPS